MGDKSKIEWTDATWNPIVGCSRVSEGCRNCYAERFAHRFSGEGQRYENMTFISNGRPTWTGAIQFSEKALLEPLRWLRPRRVFVNSMSDLFHEGVSDEMRDRIFAVMALAPQHTFQVLTKRPERMLAYLADRDTDHACGRVANVVMQMRRERGDKRMAVGPLPHLDPGAIWWPLPNVWLGVSAENQAAADERIPLLLQTPAALRFVSCEPLLGPIDFDSTHESDPCESNFLTGISGQRVYDGQKVALDWVICGGESGPGARPMHPDWARSLRDQCAVAGIPFFFKQWGEWIVATGGGVIQPGELWLDLDGRNQYPSSHGLSEHTYCMARVGKKAAGALLDGREWREFPRVG